MSKLTALPSSVNLTDFLKADDESVQFRIDGLMTVGARVLLSAQYKAGKSVMTHNIIRSLVDGVPFLGEHEVSPVVGKVVLLDTELDDGMLRRWLRDQDIENSDQVEIVSLRGRLSSFNLMNQDVLGE